MNKKTLVHAVATSIGSAFLIGAMIPASYAAGPASVVFKGSGEATALDLTIPALKGLAAQGYISADTAKQFPGITVGHTIADFGSATGVAASAAGKCQLLSDSSDPLKVCSKETIAASDTTAGQLGNDRLSCAQVLNVPDFNGATPLVSLGSACGMSKSSVVSGHPLSDNQASVAIGKVALNLSALSPDIEASKQALVKGLQQVVDSVLNIVHVDDAFIISKQSALQDALDKALQSVAAGTHAADIRIGSASTVVENAGTVTNVASKVSGSSIGLLGITDALKDGLIQIEVTGSSASASWNDATGRAIAPPATQALAIIKVKDLLALCGGTLSGDACETAGYIQQKVTVSQLNELFAPLKSVPLLATDVTVGTATPAQEGTSVAAAATGIEIHALKGLGETNAACLTDAAACHAGIDLRLAAARVTIAGDIKNAELPPLPHTGGPTYLYFTGAALLAGAAVALRRMARKLNPSA